MPVWLQRIGLLAIVALIVIAFVVTGYGQPGGAAAGAVARVAGELIDRETFEFFREQNEATYGQLLDQLPSNAQRREFLNGQTRVALIRRTILEQEAEELGIRVPDAELREDLHQSAQFQEEGRFSRELFELFAARSGLGVRGLMDAYRTDIHLRKFRRFAESPVRVSQAQTRWELERQGTTISLRYATARAADFQPATRPDDDEARELLDAEEDAVRSLYDARLSEFQRAEQIRARHILLSGENAEARAASVQQRLRDGEDFASLARELSADEATQQEGGDLGWFPRGIMLPAFDAVAFSLEPGAVGGPVETERGWHVIEVQERREAMERSFEDVALDLAKDVLSERAASQAAREAAEQVLEAARAGADLTSVAQERGLEVSTTPPFTLRDAAVPGLREIEDLVPAAFALAEDSPIALRVYEAGGSFFAIGLERRETPPEEEVDGQLEAELDRRTSLARSETTSLWYQTRRRELDEAGAIELYAIDP
jgi:peptidyl-prolyl cis-trans isomerase D